MGLPNKLILTVIYISLAACGVKGKPLPPIEPAFIGTGEPPALNKKDDKKTHQKR